MRVYVILFFTLLLSLTTHAGNDDEHEVKVVGDKNYSNNAALVYDGIDVSNYQKDINWRATAEDPSIKYVYVKATEGATHKQHRYRANIENARKHGVKVGSYHFLSTTSPIQKQFENFISMAKPEEQDLIPLLDVETHSGWSAKQLQDSVMLFAQLLEDYYGCKPMIYTNVSYFNTLLGYDFRNYPLFIARYSKSEPQLNFGAKWILWQFSDKGIISGIDEKVDLSRFNRGCSLKDITYNSSKSKKRNDKQRQNVPRPKPKKEEPKPEVPYPANQNNSNSNKEKTEAQKRGEENAKKRKKMEEKKREEERKAEEKARKEEEKKRKEIEKREKEIEKKRAEQEKKRLEQEKKQREQEEKQRREEEKRKDRANAQARMKADKDKANTALNDHHEQNDDEQKRMSDLKSAQQERLANEKSKEESSKTNKKTASKSTKSSNQSSADNDEIKYNRGGKK
ncbi:MAG: hypothetical protein IKW83_09350 [Muribaculaceae bacterium]|nr:hypothetical protein [Muribaculaceae bacterium]